MEEDAPRASSFASFNVALDIEQPERASSTSSTIHSGSTDGSNKDDDQIIKIVSLNGGHPLRFEWKKMNDNQVNVVIDIIKRMREQHTSVKAVLKDDLDALKAEFNDKEFKNKSRDHYYGVIRDLVLRYNKAVASVRKLWNGAVMTELGDWRLPYATPAIAQTICGYAFDCAVEKVKDLNSHYAPFSSEVYGETKTEQMALILEQLKLGPNDVFVDMGSGVGNIVAFTACMAKVKKCVGVEVSKLPASLAKNLKRFYEQFMAFFGKAYSPIELFEGDFLEKRFRDLITKEATVILINNFAFTPELDMRIKRELICEMNDGVRIVSTRRYAEGSREINHRKLGDGPADKASGKPSIADVEAILDVRLLKTVDAPASWTANPVPFYLHTVNTLKMHQYFDKNRGADPTRRIGKKDSKSSSSSSREGSQVKQEFKEEHDEEQAFGPTTRKKWKEYVAGMDDKKQIKIVEPASSPRWDDVDRDYVPPQAKKARKSGGEKRRRVVTSIPNGMAKVSASAASIAASLSPPVAPSLLASMMTSPPSSSSSASSFSLAEAVRLAAQLPPLPPLPTSLLALGSSPQSQPLAQLIGLHQTPTRVVAATTATTTTSSTTLLPADAQSTIDAMHEMIVSPPRHATSEDLASGQFVRVSLEGAPVRVEPVVQLPPPPQQPADKRPTFMLPPTDPLYDTIVSIYLDMKTFATRLQERDEDIFRSLKADIERETLKNSELKEKRRDVQNQIEVCLQSGVHSLKERLIELEMSNVQEVSELLHGSKQIVAQHKDLTQRVAKHEAHNASEEARLRSIGPFGDKLVDNLHLLPEDDSQGDRYANYINMLSDSIQVVPNLGAYEEPTDHVISPGVPRRSRPPRQRPGASKGRGAVGKPEKTSEDVDLEIQQFVQQAMKVESMAKEKERRARGSGGSERNASRRGGSGGGSGNAAGSVIGVAGGGQTASLGTIGSMGPTEPTLHKSGPLIPTSSTT